LSNATSGGLDATPKLLDTPVKIFNPALAAVRQKVGIESNDLFPGQKQATRNRNTHVWRFRSTAELWFSLPVTG